MSIQPLPPDVIAQIKSSITITSLNGVLCELAKNSLDANASKVDISVDYSRGSCSVEDDGLGILPSEFKVDGHLGKLYHSSKLNAQTPVHGGRGTFLASLSALALVSITSHHHQYRSHNTLTLHKSEVVSRQTPAPLQQHLSSHHGTRVTVRDLFGNMPVRVKQRALVAEKERGNSKEWETLRRDIIALLLPWQKAVAVTIRNFQTSHKMSVRTSSVPFQSGGISVSLVCSILAQASFITHDQKTSWISVHASTPKLDISGTISLEPTATKHVQFLSLGIQPIVPSDGHSIFYDEINRLFSNSAFGIEEHSAEIDNAEQQRRAKDGRYKGDGYTTRELIGAKKGVDRWPMFFINIQLSDPGHSVSGIEDVLDEKKQSLTDILQLLRVLIIEFLTKHHFRPKAGRSHRLKQTTDVEIPAIANPRMSSIQPRPYERSTSKATRSSLRTNHRPDSLVSNVRLPSFQQGVALTESPFDSWSRVKKGAVSRPTTPKILACSLEGADILRPATAPPSLTDASSAMGTPTPRRSRVQPLFSKDGKLLRAPFNDITHQTKPRSIPTQSVSALISNPREDSGDADELVAWVNPVTKVQTFVNQRTGLAMKATGLSSNSSHGPRLTASLSSQKPSQATPSPWISDLLKTWDNPIFAPAEQAIPQISFDGHDTTTQNILHGHHHHCSQIDIDRAFKEASSDINGRISKDALKHAEIISQVDQKFILVKLQQTRPTAPDYAGASMLVLIDQHAADERIRVEALMEELCAPPQSDSAASAHSGILTASLAKPLHFNLSTKEIRLLEAHQPHFFHWGILFAIPPSAPNSPSSRLTVHSLPPPILERCQSSPRLLIDLIRTELWKLHDKHSTPAHPLPPGDWLQRIHTCPQGILDMINSRACRSAIMFNDVLSKEQCQILVRRLAECKFPFQCAHGRPSLVPLVNLKALSFGAGLEQKEKVGVFGEEVRRWRERME